MFDKRIQEAVIDTGPLFSVLVLHYVNSAGFAEPRRSSLLNGALAAYLLGTLSTQESFSQLISNIPSLVTTSHVVGELTGLIKARLKLRDSSLTDFWLCSMHFLAARGLEEQLLSLLDMYRREDLRAAVGRLGATDVGVVELARRKGSVLLTDDRWLAGHAWESGVDCRLPENLV